MKETRARHGIGGFKARMVVGLHPRVRFLAVIAFASASAFGCAWTTYQGAMIDAEDYMAEGRYERALRELDRAKRTDGLGVEESTRIAELEAVCHERVALRSATP